MELKLEDSSDICEISCIIAEQDTENRIKECESQKSSEVNICSRALLQLPLVVFRLTWLRVLWLTNNVLFDLPQEFSQLLHIEVLGLAWNHFTEISPCILQLSNLKLLDLRNNQLKRIPPELSTNCKQLQYLFLSNNLVSSIPMQIGNLELLIEFQINNNKLEKLPVSIGNLKLLGSSETAPSDASCNFFEGNILHYPPPHVASMSASQLAFLRQEWEDLSEEHRNQLLTGGLNACHTFRLEVQYLNKCYTVEASAATLCELKAEIWRLLRGYPSVELPNLHLLDTQSQAWKTVTTLEEARSVSKMKIFLPSKYHQGALEIMRNFDHLLEEVQDKLNTEDVGRNWRAMASRLGFTDAATLSCWEQTGNPAKCMLHTWMSSQEASIQRLQELLQQLEQYDIAARIPVQVSEVC